MFQFHSNLLFFKKFLSIKSVLNDPVPDKNPLDLTQKNIFILPTKYGVILAGLLMVMLFTSINYEKNLGYLLTFFIGGMMGVSVLHTHRNLSGLRIASGMVKPVFAGQTAWFQLFLQDKSGRFRNGLHLKEKTGKAITLNLSPWQTNSVFIPVHTSKRGWYNLNTVRIFCTQPFGLFKIWSNIRPKMSCMVYPEPAQIYKFSIPKQGNESSGRNRQQSCSLEPEDFFEHILHNPADSYKRIDWKAFARQRGLLNKRFEHQKQGFLILDLDKVPTLNVEEKLSYLCALILQAENRKIPYGLKLIIQEIPPGLGEEHRYRCLKALAEF